MRDQIMDAARRMFAAEGYPAVSMRRIADAIEYTPTAIYGYFKDKEDLFRQICEDDFARFHAGQAAQTSDDPVDRIRQMGRAYIRFAVEHPNHFRRMFLDPPAVAPSAEQWSRRGDPTSDGYALFRSAVAAASDRLRPEFAADVELATQTLWAAVHGVASITVSHGRPDSWVTLKPVDDRSAAMIESILRGVVETKIPYPKTQIPIKSQ